MHISQKNSPILFRSENRAQRKVVSSAFPFSRTQVLNLAMSRKSPRMATSTGPCGTPEMRLTSYNILGNMKLVQSLVAALGLASTASAQWVYPPHPCAPHPCAPVVYPLCPPPVVHILQPPPCHIIYDVPTPLPYYEGIYLQPSTMPRQYSEERISTTRRVVEEREDILRVNHFGR